MVTPTVHHLSAVDLVVDSPTFGSPVLIVEGKTEELALQTLERLVGNHDRVILKGDPKQQAARHGKAQVATAMRPGDVESIPLDAAPPLNAQKFLSLLAGPRERAHLMGDLQEEFQATCARFGEPFARRQYWSDVFQEILPIMVRRLTKTIAIGAVAEYFRRKFGM